MRIWNNVSQVCIVVTILFGTTKLSLNYGEYVTSLTILGMFTAINLFCWIVVFTFRKSMVMVTQMARTLDHPSTNTLQPSVMPPNAPPPSYYETEGYKDCKPPPEDAPPEYEEAVKGPVLRKKSLTTNIIWSGEKGRRWQIIIWSGDELYLALQFYTIFIYWTFICSL